MRSGGPFPRGPTALCLCPAAGALQHPRPSRGSPVDPGGLNSRDGPLPLCPGSGQREPLPLQSCLPICPPSPETRAPACCLQRVCACSPPSEPLRPSLSCICVAPVQVSACLCLSPCACGSWRRRGVHAGTEPAVGPQRGGQRPDRLTPGPSPRSLVQVRSGATRRPVSFGADADFWEGAGPPQSS